MIKTELEMLQLAIDNYNKDNIQIREYDILYNTDSSYIITSWIEYNNGTNRQELFEKRKTNNDLINNVDDLIKEYGTDYLDCKVVDYNNKEVAQNRFLLKGDKKITIRHKVTMGGVMNQLKKYIDIDGKIRPSYINTNEHKVLNNFITNILHQNDTLDRNDFQVKQISITTFRKNLIESEKKYFARLKKYNKELQHIDYIDINNMRLYFLMERFNNLLTFYVKKIK